MKQKMSSEFIYQLFALLIIVILVHAVYVGLVRPNADALLEREAELVASGAEYIPKRSFYVVIRDFEQESCFILLIWAQAIMGYKARQVIEEQGLLEQRLLDVAVGELEDVVRLGQHPVAGGQHGNGPASAGALDWAPVKHLQVALLGVREPGHIERPPRLLAVVTRWDRD